MNVSENNSSALHESKKITIPDIYEVVQQVCIFHKIFILNIYLSSTLIIELQISFISIFVHFLIDFTQHLNEIMTTYTYMMIL